jgi:hypothetical protein
MERSTQFGSSQQLTRRQLIRRTLAIGVALSSSASLLAACGGGAQPTPTPAP